MDEGDARAVQADPRLLIDHLEAVSPRVGDRLLDVRHGDGDVVQARPALGQKLADRGVVAQRLQKLDLGLAGAQKGGLQPVLLIGGAMRQLGAESRRVEPDRSVQVVDRHAYVVNLHHR